MNKLRNDLISLMLFSFILALAADMFTFVLLTIKINKLETKPAQAVFQTTLEVKKENVEVVEEKEKYPITSNERELITRMVAAESRGEPLEGQIAVAQVILDRWVSKGGSLNEIILAPKQFANPYSGSLDEYPDCRLATHLVFDLGYRVFKEPTFFFFNPQTAEPKQIELLRTYSYLGSIGNHEFRGAD